MNDTLVSTLLLTLSGLLLVVGLLAARIYMRLRRLREAYQEVIRRHDNVVNLLGAAATVKGGKLRIPCLRPNFSVPGLDIERKGNAYVITVQGGPHL